jgi:hypothetical protein
LDSSHHETQRRDGGLVWTELGIGDPAVVVDGLMQKRPSNPRLLGNGASTVDPPAATSRDLPELLDIDMDQLASDVLLVASDLST